MNWSQGRRKAAQGDRYYTDFSAVDAIQLQTVLLRTRNDHAECKAIYSFYKQLYTDQNITNLLDPRGSYVASLVQSFCAKSCFAGCGEEGAAIIYALCLLTAGGDAKDMVPHWCYYMPTPAAYSRTVASLVVENLPIPDPLTVVESTNVRSLIESLFFLNPLQILAHAMQDVSSPEEASEFARALAYETVCALQGLVMKQPSFAREFILVGNVLTVMRIFMYFYTQRVCEPVLLLCNI